MGPHICLACRMSDHRSCDYDKDKSIGMSDPCCCDDKSHPRNKSATMKALDALLAMGKENE